MKPRVFVASSRSGLDVAYAVQVNLDYDAELTVWPQGVFDVMQYTLEALLQALGDFDFAIVIFAPEDFAEFGDQRGKSFRENVLFELGLFLGSLGRQRVFLVMPRDKQFRLPTDLLGVTPATYDGERADKVPALGPACNMIRNAIRRFGPRPARPEGHYGPLIGFHESFRQVNWSSLLERAEHQLEIVVYYFDSWINAYDES
jgi:predicted nucleotide-binding protein